jgi:formate C-acetyltransferase
MSSVIQGCLDKGVDVINGGAKYNSSGAALVSVADVIDSLLVIKQLVYEEKAVDFKTLLQALRDDFAGHEALHARIMKRVPKFGSDTPGTREMVQDIINFIYDRYNKQENYAATLHKRLLSMSNHVASGRCPARCPAAASGAKRSPPASHRRRRRPPTCWTTSAPSLPSTR